jgi:hypothetical protein
MGHSNTGYIDFCSLPSVVGGGGCADAFSVRGRLVSSNTSPGTLTRFSDSATHNVVYTGSRFKVNVSDAASFCLGNGGTTSTITFSGISSTQYNDCGWSTVVSQTGTGCNPTQSTQSNMPFFVVRSSDGESVIAQATQGNSVTGRWLFTSGCTGIQGTGPKTLVELTSNAYFSVCCGLFGTGETVPHAVSGTMYAGFLFTSGGQGFWYIDGEGGGTCQHGSLPIPLSPVTNSVGIGTFGGSGNPLVNYWWNNVQTCTNDTFQFTVNTQTGMNLGASGDHSVAGPYYFRDIVLLGWDTSTVAGLAYTIYNYMIAL